MHVTETSKLCVELILEQGLTSQREISHLLGINLHSTFSSSAKKGIYFYSDKTIMIELLEKNSYFYNYIDV